MLQSITHTPQLIPSTANVNPPAKRLFVYVNDLRAMTGLGVYQAGVYFTKIKKAAKVKPLTRYIHVDTFMAHINECPTLNKITLEDVQSALAK